MLPENPAVPAPASVLPAWLRAMRPKQWAKNVLVLAAPVAAGQLFVPAVAIASLWGSLAFTLLSAAIYLLNDIRDIAADRQHPSKRLRPIAAGELSVPVAYLLAAACLAGALGVGFWVHPALGTTLLVYGVLQFGYSLFWKHQPIIDLAIVAAGFLLRAVAGGVASGLPLSQWFLLVASFGSLFMVAGKRYSELRGLGAGAGTRASLERYTESYLRMVWSVSAGLVIMSYSLWAFDADRLPLWGVPWTAISIAPFALAILRYAMTIDAGRAGAPEEVLMHDHILLILGGLWLAPVAIAVFA